MTAVGMADELSANREAVVAALKAAVGHRLSLEAYEEAVRDALAARTQAELTEVAESVPFVALATPDDQLGQLTLRTGIGIVRRLGDWHVAAKTVVTTALGSAWLDLSNAVLDDRRVEIEVTTGLGFVRLYVPEWITVEGVAVAGSVASTFGFGPPTPGLPRVLLRADAKFGTLKLRRPRNHRRGTAKALRAGS